MRSLRSIVLAVIVGLTLGACSGAVETEVTAFHSLPSAPRGQTFVMVPYKSQEGSLEWQSYSNLVARQLEKHGLVRAASLESANFAVFLAYAIDGGRTTVSSVPIFGQTSPATTTTTTGYVGSYPVSGTSYTPATYGITGYGPVERTVYARAVIISIVDVQRTVAERKPVAVYEGTGKSLGSAGSLNAVMPAIIDGMFTDWPGPPGTTRRQSVPLKE